jgi:hypothetical protein
VNVDDYNALVEPVRRVLLETWDPIGVATIGAPRDEYDSYIPGIISLLQQTMRPEDIAAHLDEIADARMGLRPQRGRSLLAAREIVAALTRLRG